MRTGPYYLIMAVHFSIKATRYFRKNIFAPHTHSLIFSVGVLLFQVWWKTKQLFSSLVLFFALAEVKVFVLKCYRYWKYIDILCDNSRKVKCSKFSIAVCRIKGKNDFPLVRKSVRRTLINWLLFSLLARNGCRKLEWVQWILSALEIASFTTLSLN